MTLFWQTPPGPGSAKSVRWCRRILTGHTIAAIKRLYPGQPAL
ncbi:hypothetical protein [Pseudomonas peli]|nr:hypothetical protein [Pseudomonas peli]